MARRGENIRKRKDGRWEGRYAEYIPHQSKPKIKSVYARSYTEVKQKLTAARRATENNMNSNLKQTETNWNKASGYKQGGKPPQLFTDIAEEWLFVTFETKKLSTYTKYRNIYEKYFKIFMKSHSIYILDAAFMQDTILAEARKQNNTVLLTESLEKSIFCVANQIISYAVKNHHLQLNHLERGKNSIRNKPAEVFNSLEQQRLISFLYQNMDLYKFGIIVCLYTGLRIGELCSIKWSDIDMNNRIIHVNSTAQRLPAANIKGSSAKTILLETEPKSFCSRREIPISDVLYKLLKQFHHDGTYLIGVEKITDPRTYQNKFKQYLKSADMTYRSFHCLRHTFATNCASYGADPKSLSEILGHSDVRTTLNRYIHPSIESKRACLNRLYSDCGQHKGQAS